MDEVFKVAAVLNNVQLPRANYCRTYSVIGVELASQSCDAKSKYVMGKVNCD